jgi:hypothetical protein
MDFFKQIRHRRPAVPASTLLEADGAWGMAEVKQHPALVCFDPGNRRQRAPLAVSALGQRPLT